MWKNLFTAWFTFISAFFIFGLFVYWGWNAIADLFSIIPTVNYIQAVAICFGIRGIRGCMTASVKIKED